MVLPHSQPTFYVYILHMFFSLHVSASASHHQVNTIYSTLNITKLNTTKIMMMIYKKF
jgi:hypothetical protein